jgi:type I restriction-modification system DNA methylase subunit
VADGKKPNKPLFSQHYLEHRIQECPEWQVDITVGFDKLQKLYLSKKDLLPKLSEAQTEDVFIKPALDILGFSHIPQVTTRGKGRAQRPDYALFKSEIERDTAYPLQSNETAFYQRVIAIAEAKYWERPLSKVSKNDQRDIYQNENPSFQIASYLTGTGVDWGILTNGREWRLYYRQASSTATEFYQVDFVQLLEGENLDQFKYFWLFFRQESLVKDSQGRNFLERVREGSTTYATQVGNELKALVFDRIFPDLAGGFVTDATRRGETVTSEQVYEATLSFLYKLLFLLYAEARNLLPIEGDYRDYSLIKLTQEVAQGVDRQRNLSQTSTGMYDKLLNLFQIVDRGDAGLGVPRYNGGLFHFDFSQEAERIDYRANHFLSQFKISDQVLAPVLDKLARFEGQPIDYSFLGVRQLGSIYEGLLEYRVKIEDAATGKVYLENDKGERKATGSYYTPDYIVKYIVSHTIKPILEQRQARFGELMAQITELHHQLDDQRKSTQSINGLRKDLQRLEREAQSILLDIKVCDPAMGSGHFLVEAVDYLTDELIGILTEYPENNPVLEMLDQTKDSILDNLKQQGITINSDKLEPTQLLQRVVMKRCIYGVDLNPMAVELAKVSLWLHSFTIGAPLSFLDHHLRCGNSLIGTTAREAEAKMKQDESGQFNLLTGPFVGLLLAAEIMRGVSVLSDATFAEVEQSERLFRSFDEAAKPYKRLLDIYVSQFFGLKRADHFLRVYGTNAITANPKQMNKTDAVVYEEAQKLGEEKRFFHWDLEFPEVFIDLENASWNENAGFDVVVGNPPYVRHGGQESDKSFFKFEKEAFRSSADLYVYFIEKGIKVLNEYGLLGFIVSNKFMRASYGEPIRQLIKKECLIRQIIDFGELRVFEKAATFPAIILLQKQSFLIREETLVTKIKSLDFDSLEAEVDKSGYIVSKDSLLTTGWSLSRKELLKVFQKIKLSALSLNKYVISQIYFGIKTGLNEAFVIDANTRQLLITQDANSVAVIKPLIVGDNIRHYSIEENNQYLIVIQSSTDESTQNPWAYLEHFSSLVIAYYIRLLLYKNLHFSYFLFLLLIFDHGSIPTEIDARGVFYEIYPAIHNHLSKFEDKLRKRQDQGKWWWELRSCTYYDIFEDPKIVYPDIAKEPRFTLDTSGSYPINTIYTIPKKDYFLLALLDSRLLFCFMQQTSSILGDAESQGRLRFFGQYMEQLPIRKIYFTTPTNDRQQSLDNAIALYNQYQNNGNLDPILAQVDHHLSQQPEEADVIHDLLAYLAEQMIALNQQKQTEIKSFLQWLERFIGCPIDTLTNKSKIQNYLGDYNKDEPHLSFDDLIELLKKNKKKVKIDPVARKEQETLEKEYQASLDTLLPIKMQLMRCDKLIDRIVYQLYGLTEEEIAIVENKST